MKHKTFNLFTALMVLVLSLTSTQEIYALEDIPWKPIDPSELAMKEPKVEKDADAEAIFWDTSYEVDYFRGVTVKTYVRIKIFNERGRETYSKIKILNPPNTKIEDIAARVINPDGKIIEVKKEDIFDSTIVKTNKAAIKAKTFVMPNLEVGSILEYRYVEKILGWSLITTTQMIFQQEIPARLITNCARVKNSYRTVDIPKDHFTNMGKVEFVKNGDFHCATKQDVPTFHSEPFMPPEENMKPWVKFVGVRRIENKEKDENTYWADRAGTIYQLAQPFVELNEEIKKIAIQIVEGAKDDEEKLTRLFAFCRTQIKNIDFDYNMTNKERAEFYFTIPAGETLKRKAGRGAGIDYLFFSLAIAAGLDARIVRTGDRTTYNYLVNDGKQNDKNPSLGGFCVGVIIGNKAYYYDFSDIYIPQGMLPWEMEGQKSILVGPKTYVWHNTPPSNPDKSVEKRKGRFRLLEDGTLEGEVNIEFTGHIGREYKEANDELSQREREELLNLIVKGRASSAEVTNTRVENAQDPIKNFTYTFNVRIPNYAQRTGKRFFVQPNFFEFGSSPVFTSATRLHPIFFKYAWSEEDDIEIELPQGFEIENESVNNITAIRHFVGFDEILITPSQEGKTLKYKRKFSFGINGTMLYETRMYPTIKKFFEDTNRNAVKVVTLKQR